MQKSIIIIFACAILASTAFAQTPATAPTLRIVTEDPNLPSELFYGDTRIKPVRMRPGTNTPITVDDVDFYVQQHYIDFLGRFPDAPGFDFWSKQISTCNGDASCIDRQRVNVSAAFFLSSEFQVTGYYVYRLYKGALGRLPRYNEFMPETRRVAAGIVVNNMLSPTIIERNKQDFAAQFAARSEFKAIYDQLATPESYVDKLFATIGIQPSAAEREQLVGGLRNGLETRVSVLRKAIDGVTLRQQGVGVEQVFNTTYGKAFYDREFNPSFVLMQYFGYLRRNPDDAPEPGRNFDGYNFWLTKLNRFGNYADAEMVKSFIVAVEYRDRF